MYFFMPKDKYVSNTLQIFKKSKKKSMYKMYFCVFSIAGFWEEVLVIDICYITITRKKEKKKMDLQFA